jgi:diguanylate cyclase (GGDEF)-like protein
MDRLRDAFVGVRAGGSGFALLVADLDGFKGVNDRHGHDAGDLVLQVVARRLRGTARANDTIARPKAMRVDMVSLMTSGFANG